LGEILFWLGTYVAAIGSMTGLVQWVTATLGAVAILGVMTGATNGLDKKQMTKYSGTEGFEAYVTSTPKLVPFTAGDKIEDFEAIVKTAKEQEAKQSTPLKAVTPIVSTYTKNKNPWDT